MSHSVFLLSLEFIREAIKWTIFHSWTEYLPNRRSFSIESQRFETEFRQTNFLSLSHFHLEFLVNNFSPNFVCECKKCRSRIASSHQKFPQISCTLAMTSRVFLFLLNFILIFWGIHLLNDTLNVYYMMIYNVTILFNPFIGLKMKWESNNACISINVKYEL